MIKTLGSTTLLAPELTLADTKGNSCEDCPDINPDPPNDSDCPYFDRVGSVPTCTKEGNTQRQLERWLGQGIGNTVLPRLADVAESIDQLPDVYSF
jgi:hypothetical protein